MAIGMAACTSEETPTEPSGSPRLARAAAGAYTAVDLGTLGGFSRATGINSMGQVVGGSATAGGDIHAFLWSRGVMTDLGTLGGSFSWASGITAAGKVAGYSSTVEGDAVVHAVLWSKGEMTDLGTLGGNTSGATGISPAGQVVGSSNVTVGGESHATLWTPR